MIFHVTEILYYYNGITGLLPNIFSETPTGGILWREVFFGVLWDSWGGATVPESHFYNLQALGVRLCWRWKSGAVVFHAGLARFLEAHFLQSTPTKLLLFSTWCVRFRGCTAWSLMGVFCFVFINLTVEKTGKILIKVSHRIEST